MSLVVSETSPRALLDSALELSATLNLLADDNGEGAGVMEASDGRRGPGFVLKRVEDVLQQICTDLDLSTASDTRDADAAEEPLMMRLRRRIEDISTVLTGNQVEYAEEKSTTLYELIESLSLLNKSVCITERRSSCTIS